MKKDQTPDAPLNDNDIAQLFETQPVVVPDRIKHAVLEHAREAVAHLDDERDSLEGDSASDANRSAPAWLHGVFAVAATGLFAAVVLPVLMKEPGSSLDSQVSNVNAGVDIETISNDELASLAEPVPWKVSTSEQDNVSLVTQSMEVSSLARQAAPERSVPAAAPDLEALNTTRQQVDRPSVAKNNTDMPSKLDAESGRSNQGEERSVSPEQNNARKLDTQAQVITTLADQTTGTQTQAGDAGGSAGDPAAKQGYSDNQSLGESENQRASDTRPDAPPAYRSNVDKWINEIKILIVDGDARKAREEFRLLKKAFPEQAENFQPDFSRRSMKADESLISPER